MPSPRSPDLGHAVPTARSAFPIGRKTFGISISPWKKNNIQLQTLQHQKELGDRRTQDLTLNRCTMADLCPDCVPGYILKQKICPERPLRPFRILGQFCLDWLPAFFKNFQKYVRMGVRAGLVLSGVLQKPLLGSRHGCWFLSNSAGVCDTVW